MIIKEYFIRLICYLFMLIYMLSKLQYRSSLKFVYTIINVPNCIHLVYMLTSSSQFRSAPEDNNSFKTSKLDSALAMCKAVYPPYMDFKIAQHRLILYIKISNLIMLGHTFIRAFRFDPFLSSSCMLKVLPFLHAIIRAV